ncbi:hypothetical protein ACTPDI_14170 [Clostridioides difficile]
MKDLEINNNNIEIYAKLMEESFIDDSGIKIQLKGIENRARLLNIQCRCQIEAFSKINGVTTFGNGGGMVLGYFTKDEERLAQYLQDASSYILENVSTDDLITMQQNAIEVTEIVQPDWYKKFLNDEEVYILQVIVVQKSLRGTGVFRKLISPILKTAEQQSIPVVLQTYEYANIIKYEQFGFKLMEQVTSDKIDLVCYNMLKNN